MYDNVYANPIDNSLYIYTYLKCEILKLKSKSLKRL